MLSLILDLFPLLTGWGMLAKVLKLSFLQILQLQLVVDHVGASSLGQERKNIRSEVAVQSVFRKDCKEWLAFLSLLCVSPHSLGEGRFLLADIQCWFFFVNVFNSLI